MNIIDLARFTRLLIRRGRLCHSGYDFQEERTRILRDVEGVSVPRKTRSRLSRALMKHAALRAILSEVTFVRSRRRLSGGHVASADGKLV